MSEVEAPVVPDSLPNIRYKFINSLFQKLRETEALISDAETRGLSNDLMNNRFKGARDVCEDAENLLDEFIYRSSTSSSFIDKLYIEVELRHRSQKVNKELKKIHKDISGFNFAGREAGTQHPDREASIQHPGREAGTLGIEHPDREAGIRHLIREAGTLGIQHPDREAGTLGIQHHDREAGSFLGGREIYGRDNEIETLMDMILGHDSGEQGFDVISIVGMGGIGKTVIAQQIFHDQRIKDRFAFKGWVSVAQNSSSSRVVKNIITSLTGQDTNVGDGFDTLQLHLRSVVEGKMFLLVLDDVWTVDPWWKLIRNCFAYAAKGSRILVTARSDPVVHNMGSITTYHLKGLSANACWHLFSERAFHGSSADERKSLEPVGKKIVQLCRGLPLVAVTLGTALRGNTLPEWESAVITLQEWQNTETALPEWEGLRRTLQGRESAERTSEEGESNSENEAVAISSVMRFSYSHLNPKLKRCLEYCRVFPKDHSIETDTLIKLWMAQGYITSGQNEEDTENIGYSILQDLQTGSFFQDELDPTKCKIHGVMHDFLHSLPKNDCFTMNVHRVTGPHCELPHPEKARHSALVIAGLSSLPVSVCKLQKLRTLMILSDYAVVSTRWLQQIFEYLNLLRALHFSCCSIEKIPEQLGKLHQLRYLNLSYNRNLKELPDTLCDLYLLQTLNLNGCDHLEKLPEGIGKLIHLRHLEIRSTLSLRFLPRGVGKLTSLQTLNRFVVSPNSGSKAFSLKDLEKLKKLQGYLYIDGLADLASADEAREARLVSKERLFGLDLWFSGVGTDKVKLGMVLEALQPPPVLQYLGIYYYGGTMLPTWMPLLAQLTELILFKCTNCERFSSVATLPCLESLELWDMDMEELSFEDEVSSSTAFPKLKRLCFYNMKHLKGWKVTIGGDVAPQCPTLRQLSIGNCPKLEALPHHLQAKSLNEFSISECPKLKEWLLATENRNKISHIRSIKIDGQDLHKDGPSSSNSAPRATSSRFQELQAGQISPS